MNPRRRLMFKLKRRAATTQTTPVTADTAPTLVQEVEVKSTVTKTTPSVIEPVIKKVATKVSPPTKTAAKKSKVKRVKTKSVKTQTE